MEIFLNHEQAKGLADFFFDLAKGLILGGIGSAVISPEARLIAIFFATLSAVVCVKIALSLLELEEIK